MKFPILALFERALRVETRSPLMSWARMGLLVIILFLMYPIKRMAGFGWFGAPGLYFFQQLIWVNLLFITLAGLSYFASAITEEKEEGMLGLLRMTDLNPVAILLGKSTSRLIGALLLLLVQVPFILLAVTLGGVSLLQITAAYACLLAYLFLLCNIALLFSVIFRNTGTAAGMTLLTLVMFLSGPFLLRELVRSISAPGAEMIKRGLTATADFLRQANPPNRLGEVLQTGFAGAPVGFQFVSNIVLGIVFFGLAWALFDLCMRQEKDAAAPVRFLARRTTRNSRIPRGLVGPETITWKDYAFISGGFAGLFIKFAVMTALVAVACGIYFKYERKLSRDFIGGTLIWASLITTAIWLALEASRVFKEEVRWKTLSSLVMLPMSLSELAYRKVWGVVKGTLPLLAYFIVGVALVPDDFFEVLEEIGRSFMSASMFILMLLQYVLLLHLIAFLSLVLKRGALAAALAIQYVGGSMLLGFISAMFFMSGGAEAFPVLASIGCAVLIVVLHRAIGFRLERLAAQE